MFFSRYVRNILFYLLIKLVYDKNKNDISQGKPTAFPNCLIPDSSDLECSQVKIRVVNLPYAATYFGRGSDDACWTPGT